MPNQTPALLYHHLPAPEVIDSFKSNLERGLTSADVTTLYEIHGRNELASKPGKPAWLRFLLQFNEPLLYILLVAGAVKASLGSWTNAAVIWGVTIINAIIGYVQESKAEGAIASLAKTVTTETTVLRDGETLRIASGDLVPGDIVMLTSGDKVPADLRLLKARNLQIDESALTGESLPVEKSVDQLPTEMPLAERVNMAYASSFVTFGQGTGVVVATAGATEVGQISQSMAERVNLSTPLTRKFSKFSRTLLYAILAVATLTFAVGLGQGETWAYMFESAVALAVSAIPEGLPAVVTITLAIGVNRMARRHAIIRKLPAVEALGGATVICSDKTGTLTKNQMTVQAIYAGAQHFRLEGTGYSPEGKIFLEADELNVDGLKQDGSANNILGNNLPPTLKQCLIAGVLCNDAQIKREGDAWSVVGDPTEGALIAAAAKADLDQSQLADAIARLDSIPFESEYQYMATLHDAESRVVYVKGSAEVLLRRCSQQLNHRGEQIEIEVESIRQTVEAMADRGLRVLAFAKKEVGAHQHSVDHKDIESALVFIGLQGMIDPPRSEAIAAIKTCQTAGIQVKMITGDHITTARAIAQRMGIQKNGQVLAFEGEQIEAMDKAQIAQAVEAGSVFARVAPTQKLRLVEALQHSGEIVAMTGDGVNDAPALKQADIGIAMGKAGTEVARESADMLLTDDNFASIEAATEEGRTVYQNLRKAIAFLLPVNGGESMTILISVLLGRALPILSLQVLWLNMINSLTMTVPLAFEPKASGLMQQPPRDPHEPLITKELLRRIIIISLFNWILIFGVFEWAEAETGDIAVARTMAIQSLVLARIVYLLSISQLWASVGDYLHRRTYSITHTPILIIGIVVAVLLQIMFSQWSVMNSLFETAPLTLDQWLTCLSAMVPMYLMTTLVNVIDPPPN